MSDKITILYVDDEEINLILFESTFSKKYNVIGAASPKEALDILKKNKNDISVVISDMRMPEMNGVQFIKKAKKHYSEKYYFILTGFEITDEIAEALNQKLINYYFQKPFNLKVIDRAIQKLLK